MTIPNIRAFLDTAAIQTMTGDTESASSTNSAFSSLISEVLSNNASTSTLTNYLGAIPSLVNASTSSTSSSATTLLNALSSSSASTYMPPSLYTVLSEQASKTKTTAAAKTTEAAPSYKGSVVFTGQLEGANKYSAIIEKAAKEYDLDPKLIAAIMKQESNFSSSVKSYAGATGLMQLMPGTAKYVGVKNSLDPEQNIMGGAKYLRMMLDQFGGDVTTALAAYNAGPGNVKKYGGVPPFKETQNYVVKVNNYYKS
mgnify:FL=1